MNKSIEVRLGAWAVVINLIDAVGTCVGDPAKNYIFFILIANI